MSLKWVRSLAAGLLAAPLFATIAQQQAGAQDPIAPAFRALADLVEVDVSVTDRVGPVVGLTERDFEVLEDGRRQEIAVFVPIDLTAAPETAAPGGRPPRPGVVYQPGRVFIIALDTFHVSASQTPRARALAIDFVNRFVSAGDAAAVVILGNDADGQGFTDDKAALRRAIGRFIGAKANSIAMNKMNAGRDTEMLQRVRHVRDFAHDVAQIARNLAPIRGLRKILLLLSEGIDFDIDAAAPRTALRDPQFNVSPMHDPSLYRGDVLAFQDEMVQAAVGANLRIHPIDPRGAGAVEQLLIELVGQRPPRDELTREARRSHNSLRSFAEQTGGSGAIDTDNFDGAFTRILEESSRYYILGYAPANKARDGKFRRITVRVKDRGLTVQARKGYYAERATK